MANRTFTTLCSVVGEYIGLPGTTGRGPYIAGLAINEEIDDVNSMNWWFDETIVNFTLTSGAKTYVLSTSWPNFRTHRRSSILSVAGNQIEVDMNYLPPEEFFRLRLETNPQSGLPRFLTIDPYNDLIRVDRDPGADGNGRVVRTLYRKNLPRLTGVATLGVDDVAENMIVQGAIWRARRLARLDYDADKRLADEHRRRVMATPQSIDLLSLGILR